MQKLLSLLTTCAILYFIMLQFINGSTAPNAPKDKKQEDTKQEPEIDFEGNIIERTISKVVTNTLKTEKGREFMENLISTSNKPITGLEHGFKMNDNLILEDRYQIKTQGVGEKGPISCGHVVNIRYALYKNQIKVHQEDINYNLGSEKIAPGIDQIIVGMKVGQVRTASITLDKKTNDNKILRGQFNIKIILMNVIPDNFASDVKIFDDQINFLEPLVCGKKVIFNSKITELSTGNILFDSKKNNQAVKMKIGDVHYPVIFSHSLHNKMPVGIRTVIARGILFQSYLTQKSVIFPEFDLNPNAFYMLEIYDAQEDKQLN